MLRYPRTNTVTIIFFELCDIPTVPVQEHPDILLLERPCSGITGMLAKRELKL